MVCRANGLVNYVAYDVITLAEEGRGAAEDVARCPARYRNRLRQRRGPGTA